MCMYHFLAGTWATPPQAHTGKTPLRTEGALSPPAPASGYSWGGLIATRVVMTSDERKLLERTGRRLPLIGAILLLVALGTALPFIPSLSIPGAATYRGAWVTWFLPPSLLVCGVAVFIEGRDERQRSGAALKSGMVNRLKGTGSLVDLGDRGWFWVFDPQNVYVFNSRLVVRLLRTLEKYPGARTEVTFDYLDAPGLGFHGYWLLGVNGRALPSFALFEKMKLKLGGISPSPAARR